MEPRFAFRIKRYLTVILASVVILNTMIVRPASSENPDIVFTQTEESQPGTYVGEVLGKSNLKNKYSNLEIRKLRFNFMNPSDPGVNFFSISPIRGEIITSQVIDRDTLCDVVSTCCPDTDGCYITLIVGVSPQEYFALFNVRIDIIDVNDNKPVFPESSITVKISESAAVNTTLLIPIASDLDSGKNGIRRYRIQSPSNTFGIKEYKTDSEISDVALINLRKLDRETQSLYGVKVFAVDGGIPQQTGTLAVNIEVTDANDNRPVFRNSGYTVSIRENVAVNSTILQIQADDPDAGVNGKIQFSISRRASAKVKDTFKINPQTGWIKVIQPLNYEGTKVYHIPVEAKDKGPGSLPSRTTVAVHIIDVNDNSPTIHVNMLSKSGKAEVKESEKAGEIVAHILIQDIDTGQNGKVSCSVDNSYFLLIRETNISNQDVYRLITAAPLNRETTPEYLVTIVCQDMGEPKLESRETFAVRLLDINDNAPVFTRRTYTATTTENNKLGVFLLQVQADDQDVGLGGSVRYEVAPDGAGLVTVNQEGEIYASTVFDREQYDEIIFHVLAIDNGEVPLSATATVMLRIVDKNDNAPYFLDDYTFNVSENASPQVIIGKVEARDHDLGKNQEVDFRLINNEKSDDDASEYFEVTRKGIVMTRKRLDREHKPEYHLIIQAVDRGDKPQTSTTTVKVKINDKNDNSPVILFPSLTNNTVYISYLEHIAQAFTRIKAFDSDMGRNAELTYYIQRGNQKNFFAIDEHTGVIRVNKQMTMSDAGDYKLNIEVKDRGHPVKYVHATLTIVIDGTGKPITITGAYIEKQPNNKNLIIVICLASTFRITTIT
ncbi:protocadherin-9-like [Tubulanus polymorphus]|uniref:protocadherin-9-like n=1 Tax=Tubulanus polymorphus TaxID=672921 RepID=UPI003DA2915F